MTIATGDVKLMKPEVLLDTGDGGGAMTSNEVVDGQGNNLFDDISELARTYGNVSLRKVFAAVDTTTVDSYYGAHAIVSKLPDDPLVSVSMFTTKDWFDRRVAAKDNIESYLARGPKWAGHLLETQLEGQRAIQLCVRPDDDEPKVGQGLVLVENEGLATEFEQYVRVTKVSSTLRNFYNSANNTDWRRKVLTIEISDPLRYDFHGMSVQAFETTPSLGKAWCRDTRVANAASYYGCSKLVAAAAINDAHVFVEDIYTQLVPSAQSETPMVDLTAAGASSLYAPGNTNPISVSFSGIIGNNRNLYMGSAMVPGTVTVGAGATVLHDAGSVLYDANNVEVGLVEYDKGLISFVAGAPNYTGAITVGFMPAATPSRTVDTASISIDTNSRGYSYTISLFPLPQPGSLVASYMAQGKVYYLYDKGNGSLKGSDTAFGSGSVNYTTGSVILTCGALPDANTEIIFSWGKAVTTFVRSGITVPPAYIEITTANQNIAPNTLHLAWTVNGAAKTASDNGSGSITGDATGKVNYATGYIKIIPTTLYQNGTEITVQYQFGPPYEYKFEAPARDGSGNVTVVLPDHGGDIVPRSVELTWNVNVADSDMLGNVFTEVTVVTEQIPWQPVDPIVQAFDNGAGGISYSSGGAVPNGALNYSTRALTIKPDYTVKIPKPHFENKEIGKVSSIVTKPSSGGGMIGGTPATQTTTTTTTYRYQLKDWTYEDTLAYMPIDMTGWLNVRWRTDGSSATSATETFTVTNLVFDLTPGYIETIVQQSVRFTVGSRTYVDQLGSLYHSVAPTTGAGVAGGTIDYGSGKVTITDWVSGQANSLTLQSLVTALNFEPVDEVVFRVPVSPVRSGSLQLTFNALDTAAQVSVTADSYGRLDSAHTIGFVDYTSGVVRVLFKQKVLASSAVGAPWYDINQVFVDTDDGLSYIYKPRPAYADSIRYNAVGYTYIPLSSDILGLDPVRLPSDGRVPVFRIGDVAVVHNTQKSPFPGTPAVGSMLDVGRVRLSRMRVLDAAGTLLNPTMYSYDLDAGTVTLGASYTQGALVLPLYAEHRVEDMGLVIDAEINGKLTLNKPLTHAFPSNTSFVSSALIMGDLRARVYGVFSQASWTNEWSDALVGSEPIAQYNDVTYPLVTNNRGSVEERWAIIFTSSTTFRVVGENVGQIATGDTNTDLAPNNPASGQPYFSLNALGWGGGWSAGNVLRFNTAAANYPMWVARTVLQGPSTSVNDGFQVQIRGDINR